MEWALWVQEAFAVKKYAFKDEASARAALENWSFFVKVLTKSNREAAIAGTLFAQTVGLIREAIEVEGGADDRNRRDGEEESGGELWESEGGAEGREGPAVDGFDDEGVIYEVHTTEGPSETAAAAAAALGEGENVVVFIVVVVVVVVVAVIGIGVGVGVGGYVVRVDGGDVRGAASPLRDRAGGAGGARRLDLRAAADGPAGKSSRRTASTARPSTPSRTWPKRTAPGG